MISAILKKQSAKFRIALGQVSILISLLLIAAFIGLVPERTSAVLEGRTALAEAIAANSSVFLTRSDVRRIEANLQLIVERNKDILSAAVRRDDGDAMVIIGNHEASWQPMSNRSSTTSQLRVPILERDQIWGHVELRFTPVMRGGWIGFFFEPLFQLILFVSLMSLLGFYFYLGRMLKHLDPSQAIPDRVRSALDTVAEGLLVLDAKQNIVLANTAFEQLAGKSAGKLMGYRISDFPWTLEDASAVDKRNAPWNTAMTTAQAQMGIILRLALEGDKSRTFMVNCSPVLADTGKSMGVLVSFDDITELEEKEVKLRASMEAAEQANRAKSDFLANMSHEIRTPMNAILGFTEVLKRGKAHNPEESRKYLDTISSSGKHLLDLINDILDLSKVESGHMEFEQAPCAVHQIITEIIKAMSVKAGEKDISLEYCPAGPLPESIVSDRAKIRQVVTNLVGNAIKFTESGGVRVVTRLQDAGDDTRLTIEVIDSGIGMTDQQADTIFSAFVQADSSITRRFGGTGLGLAISKRFVEALGGDIAVTSAEGEGSTFSVVLPIGSIAGVKLLQPREVFFDASDETVQQTGQWLFPAAKILVVDDGVENRELLQVVLGDLGLQVDAAKNGREGTDKVLANDYDLVLMDVNMPVMGGFEAVGLLRDEGIELPIIALTASAMKGSKEQCLEAGYSGYMAKPVNIDKLTEILAGELGGKQVNADSHAVRQADKPGQIPIQAIPTQAIPTRVAAENNEQPVAHETITSSLDLSNPKYRAIVEKFVARLEQQLEAIETAWREQDSTRLADLAHWLKSSGGSVGFHQFTKPAAELEQLAKQDKLQLAEARITELRKHFSRIDLAANDPAPVATHEANPANDYDLPDTLQSALPAQHEKFRLIIQKFGERLTTQIEALDEAIEAEDFVAIKDLAHWLKGSAGSVGFDAFTTPAGELEQFAMVQKIEPVRVRFAIIRELSKRMVIPEAPPGTEQAPVKRA